MTAWIGDAACRKYPPDMWDADEHAAGDHRMYEAKTVCNGNHRVRRCPVRDQCLEHCLEHALEHDERYGVWGGMSALERSKLRRGRVA